MSTAKQPYPPQEYYQGPPPKKKHTVRNIFLALIVLGILAFGGCLALVGGAVNEADKAIKQEEKNDAPALVSEGKGFTHDGFQAAAGWKVSKEKFSGAADIKKLSVTNTQEGQRTALLTFRFYKGNENLSEVQCSGGEIGKGQKTVMDCFTTDERFPKGYQQIKVADAF